MEITLIELESINRDSAIQLLKMLDQKYFCAKEVIIILDNARYHNSEEVREVIILMRAVVCTRYGSPYVLQIKGVDKPISGDHDLLIRIYATVVSSKQSVDTLVYSTSERSSIFFGSVKAIVAPQVSLRSAHILP